MVEISVLTTFYNAEKTLQKSIESVLNQTYQNFELLLVDDGSTDTSIKIIEQYNDKRLRLLKPGKIGRAAALNLGISQAHGDYIAILDADDIACPDRLKLQLSFAKLNPSAWIICGDAFLIDEEGHITGELIQPDDRDLIIKKLLNLNPFPHSTVFFNRQKILSIGAYNERFEKSIDYSLYLKVLEHKGEIHKVVGKVVQLRVSFNSWGKRDKENLQIRYGIIALTAYYLFLENGHHFLQLSLVEWNEWKDAINNWISKKRYDKKLNAKKNLAASLAYFKKGNLFKGLIFIVKVLILDPFFWQYQGCGFNYPRDCRSLGKFLSRRGNERDLIKVFKF